MSVRTIPGLITLITIRGNTGLKLPGSGPWTGVLSQILLSGERHWHSYLRGAPEGTKVEAWEGRIFTCCGPTTWEVSVAEGCKVTVSAVYLPKKRPGLPALGPLYRVLFGWSRLLYTPSSGVCGSFEVLWSGSQVLPALVSCFDWAVRGTYRTAWVQPYCRCSHSHGSGPAVGPLSFFGVCGGQWHPGWRLGVLLGKCLRART